MTMAKPTFNNIYGTVSNVGFTAPVKELDNIDLSYLLTTTIAEMQYDGKDFSPREDHIRVIQEASTRIIDSAHKVAEAEREAAIDREQCDAMTEAAADLAVKLMAAEKINQNLEKINQDLRLNTASLTPGKCYAVYQNQDHQWKTTEASGYSLAYGIHGDEPSTISFTYDP